MAAAQMETWAESKGRNGPTSTIRMTQLRRLVLRVGLDNEPLGRRTQVVEGIAGYQCKRGRARLLQDPNIIGTHDACGIHAVHASATN